MAPVPQWEADPLRVMRNRTASASPNRRLARLSICFPIFISAPPPLQHSGGWVSVNTRKKVTFYLNDRPAIHPPLHNPRSWRASRYQGRVLFTNPEYFFHRGCSHRRSLFVRKNCAKRRGGHGSFGPCGAAGESGMTGLWHSRPHGTGGSRDAGARRSSAARRQCDWGRDDRPEVWQNVQLLLNVADFSVGEGDLQVLVHIDLFGTQIHDLLRVALDRPDLVDGEAEREGGSRPRIAGLADRLLIGAVGLLAGAGQVGGHVRVGLRSLREGRVDGTGAALRQSG